MLRFEQIPPGHRANFVTLERAFASGDVTLVRCKDRATGKLVTAICIGASEPGQGDALPFAVLLDGNPFEALEMYA